MARNERDRIFSTGERDLAGEQEPGRSAGDGKQENGIGLENRNRDAAWGDGEQENGIWLENMKLHKV